MSLNRKLDISNKICRNTGISWTKIEVFSMLMKLNYILNIVIGSFVGVFVGHGIYVFWDYKTHPDLYAMQSAPWYTSIFIYGIFTLILLIVAIIIKLIIRKRIKVIIS